MSQIKFCTEFRHYSFENCPSNGLTTIDCTRRSVTFILKSSLERIIFTFHVPQTKLDKQKSPKYRQSFTGAWRISRSLQSLTFDHLFILRFC